MNPPAAVPAVVDPRLAAGRGDEFTNAYQEMMRRRAANGDDDEDWARRPALNDDDAEEWVPRSTDGSEPLGNSNIGFKLLQKMGWKEGKGLGRQVGPGAAGGAWSGCDEAR
jgi:hypothetical protein